MATNVIVQDDASGTPVSVEPLTSLNGVGNTSHLQRVLVALRTSTGVAIDMPGDANGQVVNVKRLPIAVAVSITAVGVVASPTSTGVTLLNANTSRRGVMMYNDSIKTLFGKYDSGIPAVAPFSFVIPPKVYWEMPLPIYQGAIVGIWDGGDSSGTGANITELT